MTRAPEKDDVPPWMRTVDRAVTHLRSLPVARWPEQLLLVHQTFFRLVGRDEAHEHVVKVIQVADKITAMLRVVVSELNEKARERQERAESRR